MPAANAPEFNAYHKWLGIPVSEQPPHFYRLLGIEPFEGDSEVIAAAADRQMAHIKSFAAGQFAGESQELLNELARARVTLLNTAQKPVYDRMLRQVLAAKNAAVLSSTPRKVEAVVVEGASRNFEGGASVVPLHVSWRAPTRIAKRRRNDSTLQLLFIFFALFGAVGLLYLAVSASPVVGDKEVSDAARAFADPARAPEPIQKPEQKMTAPKPADLLERVEPPAEPPQLSTPPIVDAKPERLDLKKKPAEEKIEFVKFDLGNRTQRRPLDDKWDEAVRVTSIQGCDLPWEIKPAHGMLRENGSVRIEMAGTRTAVFTINLDMGVGDQRLLVIEGEIETDDGKKLPFTLRNVERVRAQVLKQGKQAANLLDSLTNEKNRLTAWLSSSTMKPLIQVGPAKDRVAELTKLIPQQNQYVEALRADLEVAEKICSMAEHLHKDCAIEIISTEKERIQP